MPWQFYMNRRDFLKTSAAGIGVALGNASVFQALAAESAGKTLVLGGTAFACGVACAHPDSVIVLERGIHLAPEFALTNEHPEAGQPEMAAGRDLCGKLAACGLLNKGRLRQAALPDFLANYLTGCGCPLLLAAELASCEKSPQGFRVTLCGIDGLSSLTVARILDTTAEGWQESGRDSLASQSISARLRGRLPASLPTLAESGASLREGDAPDEIVLRVALPASASWHEARLRLHAVWNSVRASLPGLSLAAESPELARSYRSGAIRRTGKNGITWIPSAQFGNFVTAFEKGMSCTCL